MTTRRSDASSSPIDVNARAWAVTLAFVLLAGCGGAGGEASTASAAQRAASVQRCADVAPPEAHQPVHPAPPRADGKPSALEVLGLTPPDDKPWSEMSDEEREWYMVGKVLPVMKDIFQAHDVEAFAEVRCETCHGEKMKDVEFAMPSRELPAIPRPGTPAYGRWCEKRPETMVFMETKVTPAMGKLLGEDDFGCAGCHEMLP